jgi:ATP-binding cassette, subfamily F, member 3
MISLVNVVLTRGQQTLLDDASLLVHAGQKLGIIGRNGSGKTSLFACLLGEIGLDRGELHIPDGLRLATMRQEFVSSSRSALDFVIDGDRHYRDIEARLEQAESGDNHDLIAQLHGELDRLNAYNIAARAKQLLSGLGFLTHQFDNTVASFSGGWRIRLNLAAALMCPSDILLLDEPTNHLDLEATLWLEQWLNRYQGTLMIISHDRDFLDRTISAVLSFENRKLILYRGNFSAYEKQRAERLALQQTLYEKQQRRRAEIEDFVRRFRAKATKARQAQSRLKELQRMEEISLAHVDSPFDLHLPAPDNQPEFLLSTEKLMIGFEKVLVKAIGLTIRSTTRLGLLGFNGSGKSTLLKTLAGQLQPLAGELVKSRLLRVGYFAQHQVDVLDLKASPLLLLQRCSPERREQEIRDYLGGFDFHGGRVEEAISKFSGGEKARLALAMVAWQKPNLLLLDEPTNHLDLELRHALTVALQGFPGAIVLISHDRHLLRNTVDEFYSIHEGTISEFDGDLSDYEDWLQSRSEEKTTAVASQSISSTRVDKKAQRQQAAATRERLAPLRKTLQHLDKEIAFLTGQIEKIEITLTDASTYDERNKAELARVIKQQGELKSGLLEREERWLTLSEEIEQLAIREDV